VKREVLRFAQDDTLFYCNHQSLHEPAGFTLAGTAYG
jgi:hypothetical protein